MVLLVECAKERIRELLEWGGRADVVYLANMLWTSFSSMMEFKSVEHQDWRDLTMNMEFAALAARAMQYLYGFKLFKASSTTDYSLTVEVESGKYYGYSWCTAPSIKPFLNACSPNNIYSSHDQDNLSLKPSVPLFNIVSTQLSGFI